MLVLLAGVSIWAQNKPHIAITTFNGDNSVTVEQLEFITSKFTVSW